MLLRDLPREELTHAALAGSLADLSLRGFQPMLNSSTEKMINLRWPCQACHTSAVMAKVTASREVLVGEGLVEHGPETFGGLELRAVRWQR